MIVLPGLARLLSVSILLISAGLNAVSALGFGFVEQAVHFLQPFFYQFRAGVGNRQHAAAHGQVRCGQRCGMADALPGNIFAKLLDQCLRLRMAGQDEGEFLAAKTGRDIKRPSCMTCQR